VSTEYDTFRESVVMSSLTMRNHSFYRTVLLWTVPSIKKQFECLVGFWVFWLVCLLGFFVCLFVLFCFVSFQASITFIPYKLKEMHF